MTSGASDLADDPRYRPAIELAGALPEPIALIDHSGLIVHANPRLEELLETKSGGLDGTPFEALVVEGDADDLLHRWLTTSSPVPGGATLRTAHGEEVRVRADGCWLPVLELVLVRVRVRQGAANGFGRLRDEVERRNLRELRDRLQRSLVELHATNERLARTNEDLDRYASIVSHDLRAPLALIGASLDLVETSELEDDQRRLIEVAERAAAQMAQTIEALLTLARREDADRPAEPTDPARVVEEVLGTLDADLRAAGAEVDVRDLPPVSVQPAHLRQVFQNLVANSVRFRSADRTLAIAVSGHQAHDGTAVIEVSDNGLGVPEDERERVFEPMVRGSTTSAQEGTGIGLAVVRRICRAYGGEATITDREGPGVTFRLVLPGVDR